jgi:hypothetical protein
MRKFLFNYSFYSHPEIGKFQGVTLLSEGGIKVTKGAWRVPKWRAFVASQVVLLEKTW